MDRPYFVIILQEREWIGHDKTSAIMGANWEAMIKIVFLSALFPISAHFPLFISILLIYPFNIYDFNTT